MDKIKVGILTFHRSINYGAFLQCFSLVSKLNELYGEQISAEVIDYCPEFEVAKYEPSIKNYIFGSQQNRSSTIGILKNIAKLILTPQIIKQKRQLNNAFIQSYKELKRSEKSWITDDYISFLKEIGECYDIVIVGSDAIWETKVFPFPNAYFLDKSVHAFKMSYAACSGRMDISMYTEDQKRFLADRWNDFSYIGVRDETTENLIHSIDKNISVYHNCDPTITLDFLKYPSLFDKTKCKDILKKHGIDTDKPIIGLMGGNALGKLIRELFGNKYQIVALYYPNRHADVYIPDLTPFEWACMFSCFFITFTRFFHGTIFSLKNGVPTISVDDWKLVNSNQNSKLKDLLIRLGLEDYYYSDVFAYSNEGKDRIRKAVIKAEQNCQSERIYSALDKERASFNSFSGALESLILRLKEEKAK